VLVRQCLDDPAGCQRLAHIHRVDVAEPPVTHLNLAAAGGTPNAA
jgi:hypothetical protein